MPRIPLGDFGNAVPRASPSVRVPEGAFDTTSGIRQLTATVGDIAAQVQRQQKQESDALARASAANAILDRDLAVKSEAQKIDDELNNGTLDWRKAQEEFRARVGKIQIPTISGADQVTSESMRRGILRNDAQSDAAVERFVDRSRRADFRGQTDLAIDKIGKLSSMPGVLMKDVEGKIHALDPVGKVAYGGAWEGRKQSAIDAMWYGQATQRVIQSKNDPEALSALEKELTEGYNGKLDAEKRNILLRSVTNERMRLEAKSQHEIDKREKIAERTIGEIDRQISAGVPASPDMWARWGASIKGTAFEQDFNQRINDEARVQEILRAPIDQQKKHVNDLEARLMSGGGSLRDKANIERLKTAVETGTKQLQNDPLTFAQNRLGYQIPEFDMAALSTPQGATQLREVIADRSAAIGGLQRRFGSEVKPLLLLPHEAKALSSAIESAKPDDAARLYATMFNIASDERAYNDIMRQIAPDAPVKAFAGMLMAKQGKITLQSNVFSANVVATSQDVGKVMLEGERILNKTRAQRAEDGKPSNFPLPPEKEFRDALSNVAGKVFARRPEDFETATQAVRAYYTGAAAKDGDVSGVIDGDRMKQAIRAVLGEVVDFNGGGEVLAPWGMSSGDFRDKARAALAGEIQRRKLPASVADNMDALGLQNLGDGTYYVKQGRNYLMDAQRQPVIIDLIRRPNLQSASGKIRAQ